MRRTWRLLFATLALCISATAFAGDDFDGGEDSEESVRRPMSLLDLHIGIKNLGFVATPEVRFSRLKQTNVAFGGGRAGVQLNRVFELGFASYGMMNRVQEAGDANRLDFKYSGVTLGVGSFSESRHGRFMVLVASAHLEASNDDGEKTSAKGTVIEPGYGYEANLYPFVQFGFGLSYRFVSVPKSAPEPSKKLTSTAGYLSLSFGWL